MEPFVGEIRLFAMDFAPKGWAMCNGQLLSIQTNTALFSLLGTTYGGDGRTTFALPNLQGRIPVHVGTSNEFGYTVVAGQSAGEESHTLIMQEIPAHMHTVSASSQKASESSPVGNVWAARENSYATADASLPDSIMHSAALSVTGGSQRHENRQPYIVLNFCIALTGIFPPRS
ncbi:phage tail protein [Brevibacillus centrosporus]|uniref:phage tail protein n=1 Tax=Brevibacillus centrosporus TaxID=54910 RepID=UPI003B01E364